MFLTDLVFVFVRLTSVFAHVLVCPLNIVEADDSVELKSCPITELVLGLFGMIVSLVNVSTITL